MKKHLHQVRYDAAMNELVEHNRNGGFASPDEFYSKIQELNRVHHGAVQLVVDIINPMVQYDSQGSFVVRGDNVYRGDIHEIVDSMIQAGDFEDYYAVIRNYL